jgi:hypothetical protein
MAGVRWAGSVGCRGFAVLVEVWAQRGVPYVPPCVPGRARLGWAWLGWAWLGWAWLGVAGLGGGWRCCAHV